MFIYKATTPSTTGDLRASTCAYSGPTAYTCNTVYEYSRVVVYEAIYTAYAYIYIYIHVHSYMR